MFMCVYINSNGYKKIIICCRNMANNEAILLFLFFFPFALLPGCLCLAKSETIPGLHPHKAFTGWGWAYCSPFLFRWTLLCVWQCHGGSAHQLKKDRCTERCKEGNMAHVCICRDTSFRGILAVSEGPLSWDGPPRKASFNQHSQKQHLIRRRIFH